MANVSVIMGIYNCADTLPEAIDSLLAQTFTDWNLVMCDDGHATRRMRSRSPVPAYISRENHASEKRAEYGPELHAEPLPFYRGWSLYRAAGRR